jgi:hypothetical protein
MSFLMGDLAMFHELLEQIESYIRGECGLKDLEGWLLSNLQTILDSGDRKAIELADELDADLVELNEALIDEQILRERIEGRIRRMSVIPLAFPKTESQQTNYTGSSETTSYRDWMLKPVVDIRLVHEFA